VYAEVSDSPSKGKPRFPGLVIGSLTHLRPNREASLRKRVLTRITYFEIDSSSAATTWTSAAPEIANSQKASLYSARACLSLAKFEAHSFSRICTHMCMYMCICICA